jgi:hypothetical protein
VRLGRLGFGIEGPAMTGNPPGPSPIRKLSPFTREPAPFGQASTRSPAGSDHTRLRGGVTLPKPAGDELLVFGVEGIYR